MDGVTTVTDRGVPPDDDSHPWMSLLHELDSCEPLYNATGPAQGGRAFSGWEVPDWLMKRVRDALCAGRCPDCALLADYAPGEITEAYATMNEPTTEAGRRLLDAETWPDDKEHRDRMSRDILAIEAEARASQPLTLDVERLARATAAASGAQTLDYHREWARKVAAEYERLGKP